MPTITMTSQKCPGSTAATVQVQYSVNGGATTTVPDNLTAPITLTLNTGDVVTSTITALNADGSTDAPTATSTYTA